MTCVGIHKEEIMSKIHQTFSTIVFNVFRIWFIVGILNWVANGVDIRQPPDIIVVKPGGVSDDQKVFNIGQSVSLRCEASGIPLPEIEWRHNGAQVIAWKNIDREQINKTMTAVDGGDYQCIASNTYGTSLSQKLSLRQSIVSPYSSKDVLKVTAKEGIFLQISRSKTNGDLWFPPPIIFKWVTVKDVEEYPGTPVVEDERVQIDDYGNLLFSHLLVADGAEEIYRNEMYNPVQDVTLGGSYTQLNVTPADTCSTDCMLMNNNRVKICFSPDAAVTWRKGSEILPVGRKQALSKSNTQLTITELSESDAGNYTCEGKNNISSQHAAFEILVEAAPMFLSSSDKPANVNVTEGGTSIFTCLPFAIPTPQVIWMRNGIELKTLPPKYSMSPDGRSLAVTDVCKDCVPPDLAVIQCSASNKHGETIVNGYLNVLKRTIITGLPKDVRLAADKATATFSFNASSDDSTVITYQWFKYVTPSRRRRSPNTDSGLMEMKNISDAVFLDGRGTMVLTLPPNSSDRQSYSGRYRAVASNGYSYDMADAYLRDDLYPPLSAELSVPIIVLISVIAFLLLVFLLLVLLLCLIRSRRGAVYRVDKRERLFGNDPEKDLENDAFHDYQRPEDEYDKGVFRAAAPGFFQDPSSSSEGRPVTRNYVATSDDVTTFDETDMASRRYYGEASIDGAMATACASLETSTVAPPSDSSLNAYASEVYDPNWSKQGGLVGVGLLKGPGSIV